MVVVSGLYKSKLWLPKVKVPPPQARVHRLQCRKMPESFAALDSEEWDSWISHFEDCAVINGCGDERKAQFLAVRMRRAALLQLQSLATGVRGNYATLKEALREKFVPKERIELHKAKFRARHRERDEKLPDLASPLRRLVSRAYPEAVPDLQDGLAKEQLIDTLEDREIRMKLRESGPKTLHEVVSHALQIEAMYEAESRRGKGRSVRVVQESSMGENSELVELIKQNTAAMNHMVNFVQQQQQQQQQQPSSEPKRTGQGLRPNAGRARDLRFQLCFKCHTKGHFMVDCKQTSAGSGNKS